MAGQFFICLLIFLFSTVGYSNTNCIDRVLTESEMSERASDRVIDWLQGENTAERLIVQFHSGTSERKADEVINSAIRCTMKPVAIMLFNSERHFMVISASHEIIKEVLKSSKVLRVSLDSQF